MGSLGPSELLIIGVVVIALFGASRLPQTAKGLAQSLRVFRQELRDEPTPVPSTTTPPAAGAGQAPIDEVATNDAPLGPQD